jgi:4-oxalocrotonate tautomerase
MGVYSKVVADALPGAPAVCETSNEGNMPEIIVYAVEGRSAEQKKGLMKDITEAMVKNFGVKAEVVTVQIVESPKDSKAKGGVPFTER